MAKLLRMVLETSERVRLELVRLQRQSQRAPSMVPLVTLLAEVPVMHVQLLSLLRSFRRT
jgi:5-methylthioribose kinase